MQIRFQLCLSSTDIRAFLTLRVVNRTRAILEKSPIYSLFEKKKSIYSLVDKGAIKNLQII